jgi:hypothetical protein
MVSKFEKYVYTIVCSVAMINKENKFKGFLSSEKYKRIFKNNKDGTVTFNQERNNKLKTIALKNLKQKIKLITKEDKYFSFGPIIFR